MLPLIKIKNRILPSLSTLHYLAMEYIFNRAKMKTEDQALLEEGVDGWSKKIDLDYDERTELKRVVNALIADEKGFFDRAKILLQQYKGDYRRMYSGGLPYIDVENRKFFNKS